MVTKFTQEQRNEWIDIQMQKAQLLEEIDTLEVEIPDDLEMDKTEEIATVKSQIQEIYDEKQARAGTSNPMSRDEYIQRTAPLQYQLITYMEQDDQIKARNEMRWNNAHASHQAAKEAKHTQIASLKQSEKTTFSFDPPFVEKVSEV